jgi:hypothetical protein
MIIVLIPQNVAVVIDSCSLRNMCSSEVAQLVILAGQTEGDNVSEAFRGWKTPVQGVVISKSVWLIIECCEMILLVKKHYLPM